MPGGMEDTLFDDQGLYVYYLLNDFGAWIGWLGVVIAAGAVAYMAFRERTVAKWIGVVSVLPVLQTTLMVVGPRCPGRPGAAGPDVAVRHRARAGLLEEDHHHPLTLAKCDTGHG